MQYIDKFSSYIAKAANQDEEKTELVQYGIKVIWNNLSKTVLLFGICAILGIFLQSAFMFGMYAILRISAFGVHFKNSIVCAIAGLSVYLICIYTAMNIVINDLTCLVIFLVCFIIFAIYAPAQTEKRPIGPNQYKRFKIISLITVVAFFAAAILLKDSTYRNLTVFPVILESICILPLTYKVMDLLKWKEAESNEKVR